MIGRFISHYEIIKEIGRGGMGIVYKAMDNRLLRPVALKVLPEHLVQDEKTNLRFTHEAQAASLLNHPNICTVYDIGEENGVHFIAFEFIDGKSLRKLLQQKGHLKEGEVIDFATQVCDALSAAHAKGIIHRDIKPDNLMLTPDGVVKVMDFGLAKLKSKALDLYIFDSSQKKSLAAEKLFTTSASTLKGTVSYMSPEQAQGLKVDERTDIWSLGVTMYELLSGQQPFTGQYDQEVLYKIVHAESGPIAKVNRKVSPAFSDVVEKSIEKNKKKRYRKIKMLRDDLEIIGGHSIEREGTLYSSIFSAMKTAKGKKQIFALAFILIAAFAILLYLSPVPQKTITLIRSTFQDEFVTIQEDSICSIAIAPFWSANQAGAQKGTMLKLAIEEELNNYLEDEPNIEILLKENIEIPRSHTEARSLGQKLRVEMVIWGEVSAFPHKTDFQAYVTIVDTLNVVYTSFGDEITASFASENQFKFKNSEAESIAKNTVLLIVQYFRQWRTRYLATTEEWLTLNRRISPRTYGSLVQEGSLLWLDGRLKEAEKALKSAIQMKPNLPYAFNTLGHIYKDSKQYGLAIEAFQKTSELRGGEFQDYTELGVLYHYMGRSNEAIKWLKKGIEREPNSIWTLRQLGNALFGDCQYQEAFENYQRALDLSGENVNPQIMFRLARTKLVLGNYEDAIRFYKKTIKVDPNYGWTHRMLGLVYLHQSKFNKAAKELKKEIQNHSSRADHYTRLAALYFTHKDDEKAIQVLDQSLAIDSSAILTQLVYHLVLVRAGRDIEAKAQLEEAQSHIEKDARLAPVVRFYAGEIDEDAVLRAAVHNKCYDDRTVKCEAYYYLAMAYLLGIRSKADGETANEQIAKDYFQKCVDTETRNFWEYEFARAELRQLEGAPPLPKWPPFL